MKDVAENLALDYIKLREIGCIQFNDMTVTVHCKSTSDKDIVISADLKSIGHFLKVHSCHGDIEKQCKALHGFFQQCISEWKEQMAKYHRYVVY